MQVVPLKPNCAAESQLVQVEFDEHSKHPGMALKHVEHSLVIGST